MSGATKARAAFDALVAFAAGAEGERRNRRGRPPGRSGVSLIRALIVLEAYQRAVASGRPKGVAESMAIVALRRELPGASISRAEVKRIKAEFMPESAGVALVATGPRNFSFGDRRRSRRGRHSKAEPK